MPAVSWRARSGDGAGGEELVGCLGVVDGARQHQGADETRQDGHRPAAARDAAPIRTCSGRRASKASRRAVKARRAAGDSRASSAPSGANAQPRSGLRSPSHAALRAGAALDRREADMADSVPTDQARR